MSLVDALYGHVAPLGLEADAGRVFNTVPDIFEGTSIRTLTGALVTRLSPGVSRRSDAAATTGGMRIGFSGEPLPLRDRRDGLADADCRPY